MTDDDLCPKSDLPPDQCALPCHRDERLPVGFQPEVRRGVEPTGFSTPLTVPAAEQHETRDTRSRPVKPKRPRTACRYVGEDWLTREHVRDCDDPACEGCKPCDEDHCALFGCPQHVIIDTGIITCPSCIGEFRDCLSEVEILTTLVHVELEHARPADPDQDIDEVVNLSGPFADPDQIDARRSFVERVYAARGWCDWPRLSLFDVDEQNHPVEVLARWERDLRREYELPDAEAESVQWPLPHPMQRDLLSRSAEFIRGMLAGRFPHDEPFEACLKDIRRLRTHLEGVLSDSRAPETGAPCPTCGADPNVDKPQRLTKRHGHWCDDPDCHREHVSTKVDSDGVERPDTSKDEWVCPTNRSHVWSNEDYRKFVEGAYLAHADRLTTRQITEQYAIPQGTIRRWASTTRRDGDDGESVEVAPKLRPAGKTQRGVLLYRVADVLALRAREQKPATEGANA